MARTSAATDPNAGDPLLRGRTCAVPFEDVWQAALRVVRERLRGWTLDSADDQEGRVLAHVQGFRGWLPGVVEIMITLDPNGQTRVDAQSVSPDQRRDWGANARRLRRFFAALDREIPREQQRRRGLASERA